MKSLKKIGIDVSEQVSENQLQEQEKTKIAEVGEKETKPTVEIKKKESKKEAPKLDIKKKN